jgi:bacterioferritin-associated ferredoxin
MSSGWPNLIVVYTCLCRAVSDRKVRKAIGRGAATIEEVGRACGAGTGCGGCHPEIQALICQAMVAREPATVGAGVEAEERVPALSRR